jgi:non-homologous end joining protein Ku
MLDAKLAGEKITRPEPVAETPVVDLMEALRRSVAEVQDKKGQKPNAQKPKAQKTGAQKTSAQKTKATPSGDGSRRKAPARK